jgi:hypothetical protein
MSVTVIGSFQVGDFDNRKAVFDDDADNWEKAGIDATAYKKLEDGNRVHVIGTVPSKKEFLAFLSQPELRKRVQDSGTLGPPGIKCLEFG